MLAMFGCILLVVGTSAATSAVTTVPVIDVASFTKGSPTVRQSIADSVGHAFSEFGFAVITGHGIHDQAYDEVYEAGKEFFHLPIGEKIKHDLGKGYGYGGYLNSMEIGGGLSGAKRNQSDRVESLTFRGLEHVPEAEVCMSVGAHPPHFSHGHVDVPQADPVPCSPKSLQPSIMKLHAALFEFKVTIMTILELALGAEPGDFNNTLFYPSKGGLRLALYPEMSEDPVAENIDYGAHADSGTLGFLRLDRNNPTGTQVLYKQKWLPVPSVPGGLVVNLGTVLSILSGGRWKSAVHRATRSTRMERMSIISSLVPRNDVALECLPHLCGVESGAARKISIREYLDARVRLMRPDKSTDDANLVKFIDQLV